MLAISRVERRNRMILKRKLFAPDDADDVTGPTVPYPAEDDGGRIEWEP